MSIRFLIQEHKKQKMKSESKTEDVAAKLHISSLEAQIKQLEQELAAAIASQAQQSQAARLLLLKLEIEHICDDVKYAKDAKLAIQKLDFSKAASQAQQDDICPDCGRKKAKSADDCAAGLCPKWYAIRDKEAAKDCQTVSQAQQESLQIGEMRENGVNWYGKNPHAFPVGTKFFALPPAPVSDNEQPEGDKE